MAQARPELVEFLLSELQDITALSAKRFFGGWQILSEGRQFAIVMKGTVFFRVEGPLREDLQNLGSRPFSYTKQGSAVSVPKYMSAPEELFDDPDLLSHWVRRVLTAT